MKILLLLIAVGLVGVVLYVGYKMDKAEEQNERKRKYNKNNTTNKSNNNNARIKENIFASIANKLKDLFYKIDDFIDEKRKERVEKKLQKIEKKFAATPKVSDIIDDDFSPNDNQSWETLEDEIGTEDEEIEEPEEVEDTKVEIIEEVSGDTVKIPENIKELEEEKDFDKTMVVTEVKEIIKEEPEEMVGNLVDEFEGLEENLIDNESEEDENIEENIVFNNEKIESFQKIFKDSNLNADADDLEEDDLLLDLKKEIADANIKRFRRNKNAVVTKKEIPKDYTIIKNETTKKSKKTNTKKFTRKKDEVEEKKEDKKEEKQIEKFTVKKTPGKRGRKKAEK